MTTRERVVFDITSKDLVFAIKKQKRTEKKVSYDRKWPLQRTQDGEKLYRSKTWKKSKLHALKVSAIEYQHFWPKNTSRWYREGED